MSLRDKQWLYTAIKSLSLKIAETGVCLEVEGESELVDCFA